ncbi:MAG TPA: S8 family serine peptidase [Planctomycetaceae bacterium]|jgi:hypothetical protein|nr:S8 family serine peptidase [Planctomycetaceae bacterium]
MSKKPRKADSSPRRPERIFCQAFVRSKRARSLVDAKLTPTAKTVAKYQPTKAEINAAVKALKKAGFEVLAANKFTISITAPPETIERVFGVELEFVLLRGDGPSNPATYVVLVKGSNRPDFVSATQPPLSQTVEGISLNRPVRYASSPFPPSVRYWHLDVPDGIATALNAWRAHHKGITGRGVRVTLADTGWCEHPYFSARGYHPHVVLAPGITDPDLDPDGHGTAMVANCLAAAPDAECVMVKMGKTDNVGAFWKAIDTHPDIISCSWGAGPVVAFPLTAEQNALAAAIAYAVAHGTIVLFAAANGSFEFPGQHPDVISIGGANLTEHGQWTASDYASGYTSPIYPGRVVPDVCGVMGMLPIGVYIMMPVSPNGSDDAYLAGAGAYPAGDETQPDDGWAAFSGTSATTAQVAGVCALVKQRWAGYGQAKMRKRLQKTAIDVTTGHASAGTGGNPALVGPDLATGYGVVDAYAAVK